MLNLGCLAVDGFYNVPEAINCIGVTNTVSGHNIKC
jgi:hypothetical protein